MRRQAFGLIGCGALLLTFGATAWLASREKSATFDEPLHLVGAWVQTHDRDFRDNPEDPPLWKYFVALGTNPASLSIDRSSPAWKIMLQTQSMDNIFSGRALFALPKAPNRDADALIAAARARMTMLGIGLGGLIAWWAWRLAGPAAAVIATSAFCLDPNFLAHAPLIKNDVPLALALVGLMAAVWLLGERATPPRLVLCGLLLGAAITTKFSGVLALPMIAVLLTCRAVLPQPWLFWRWTLQRRSVRLVAAASAFISSMVLAYGVIWACYQFRFAPATDPSQMFDFADTYRLTAINQALRAHGSPPYVTPETVQGWLAGWRPGAEARIIQWTDARRLLPQAFLFGFQYTYAESLVRATFLRGRISLAGWWYYFPLVMAYKTPLATLAALPIAFVATWRPRRRKVHPHSFVDSNAPPYSNRQSNPGDETPPSPSSGSRFAWAFCSAVIPPAMYLAFAMTNHLNLGIRHVLPIYPFLFIGLGVVAARGLSRATRATTVIVISLIAGLMLETYSSFPDFIPFFNWAAGSARGGIELLSDSNLDWGQELLDLARWQRQHADRQLFLCYFGTADPRYEGIHYVAMPGGMAPADESLPRDLPPVYAFSASMLQGVYLSRAQMQAYDRFRHRQPDWVLGGSMYLFEGP